MKEEIKEQTFSERQKKQRNKTNIHDVSQWGGGGGGLKNYGSKQFKHGKQAACYYGISNSTKHQSKTRRSSSKAPPHLNQKDSVCAP